MIELDVLVESRQMLRMLLLYNRIISFQNFVYTFHGSQSTRYHVAGFREVLQRIDNAVENNHVINEGRGIDGGIVSENQRTSEPKYDDNQDGSQEFAHGVCQCLADGYAAGSVTILVAAFVEPVNHFLFCREGFDDTQAAQCLFQLCHGFSPFPLSFERLSFQFTAYFSHNPSHGRQYQQCEHCQLPADNHQGRKIRNNQNRVLQ